MDKKDYSLLFFKTAEEWRDWLDKNHAIENGVWVKMFKKKSNVVSPTYSELLDEALCFGWIDGQAKSIDDKSYMQKFTPRRKRSLWSKINIGHIERLTKEGKMHAAGIKAVENAKNDGRWDNAYNPPSAISLPEDFTQELQKNTSAESFFNTLSKSNKYAIAWRLETAKKPETKLRRLKKIIEMLEKGETFH